MIKKIFKNHDNVTRDSKRRVKCERRFIQENHKMFFVRKRSSLKAGRRHL